MVVLADGATVVPFPTTEAITVTVDITLDGNDLANPCMERYKASRVWIFQRYKNEPEKLVAILKYAYGELKKCLNNLPARFPGEPGFMAPV